MYRWKTGITRCNYWFIRLIILKTCLHIHNRLFKQCCVVILHNCVVSYLMQNVWSSSIALRQKNYHLYVAKLHRSEILHSLVQVYHSQFVYKIRSNIFNWNSIMIINCYKIHIWRTQKSVWTTLTRDGQLTVYITKIQVAVAALFVPGPSQLGKSSPFFFKLGIYIIRENIFHMIINFDFNFLKVQIL